MKRNNSTDEVQIKSYPWYLDDWFASETRASFNLAERGLYREMLDFCWYYGSLPPDVKLLAKLVLFAGKTWEKGTPKRFQRCSTSSRLAMMAAVITRRSTLTVNDW